jgi:hypothetical protein
MGKNKIKYQVKVGFHEAKATNTKSTRSLVERFFVIYLGVVSICQIERLDADIEPR